MAERPRSARAKIALWAIGGGTIFAMGFAATSALDEIDAEGLPRERARVVAVEDLGYGCGRFSDAERVDYVSQDPPSGLPSDFTDPETCDNGASVGDVVEVARAVEDDGSVTVYQDPPSGALDVAGEALAGAVIGSVLGGAAGLAEHRDLLKAERLGLRRRTARAPRERRELRRSTRRQSQRRARRAHRRRR
ncbi:hypothetical protein [Nocardioides sp.]|uniref:hypothetical protein n=1 Tax=Nocardioides sp. TaxID=35761 RepID=UPI0035188A50